MFGENAFTSYLPMANELILIVDEYDASLSVINHDGSRVEIIFVMKPRVFWHLITGRCRVHGYCKQNNRCYVYLLTQLPLDQMAAILQTKFSNAFSWLKSFVSWFESHWSLFLRVPWLTLVQAMAWRGTGNMPLKQSWSSLLLNSLRLRDAYMRR